MNFFANNKDGKALLICLAVILSLSKGPVFASENKDARALTHYIMAVVYDDLGEVDSAIGEYKKAIREDNESASLHLNLASSYIKKNDIPSAVEELKVCVKLNTEAIEPHAILALLYSSQGKSDLATIEYELALKAAAKQEPKNIDIYKGLGAIYIRQKKFLEAESTFRLITEIAPSDAEGHFYLGSIYNELKKDREAEKELRRSIQLKPDYADALNYLGYIFVEEDKNLNEAEGMIKKALSLDAENGAYLDSLGWLYFKRGKVNEALKELERAISLYKDPVIYDHLGDAYFKIKDFEKSEFNWKKSLELDANQDSVKEKLANLNKK